MATNTISGGMTMGFNQTDFKEIVRKLVLVEERVIVRQEIWMADWEHKITAINDLDSRLVALKLNNQDYDTAEEFMARAAKSNDEDVATITSTSTAALGSYNLEVGELIKEKRASRPVHVEETIIKSYMTNEKGQPIDKDDKVIVANAPDDPEVIAVVANALKADDESEITYVEERDLITSAITSRTYFEDGVAAATFDGSTITLISDNKEVAMKQGNGNFVLPDDTVIPTGDPTRQVLLPFNYLSDENGQPIDLNGDIIAAKKPDDPGLLAVLAKALEALDIINIEDASDLVYVPNTALENVGTYKDKNGETVAIFNGSVITSQKSGADSEILARFDGTPTKVFSLPESIDGGADIGTGLPENQVRAPMTITMDGKTLVIDYDHNGDLETSSGSGLFDPDAVANDTIVYHEGMDMADLHRVINNALDKARADWKAHEETPVVSPAEPPLEPPNIEVSLEASIDREVYGQTMEHNILMITGLDGGLENKITMEDPTDIHLDKGYVNQVVKSSWFGSANIEPSVTDTSNYTGTANKTITVLASDVGVTSSDGSTKLNGVLGKDDITFTWADGQGNGGKFVVKSYDWDPINEKLKEPIALLQGIEIDLSRAEGAGGDNIIRKNEAFTIDCHVPVKQKAADTGLAQGDQWVHKGVADPTSPVTNGGVFAYSYAGEEYTVKINGDATISGLAAAITSDPDNPGVIATVLNDGQGTPTSHKLILSGARSGVEYSVRVLDTTDLKGMDTGPEAWTHSREASNSMIRRDGLPADKNTWLQRSTNEIGDVIDGVVATIHEPGKCIITVQSDVTEMVSRVNQVVESVNFVKQYIKEQTKWGAGQLESKFNEDTQMFERGLKDGEGELSGIMIGNYGFQMAQSNIDRLMTRPIFTRDDYILAKEPNKDGDLSKLPIFSPPPEPPDYEDIQSQQSVYDDYLESNGLIYTTLAQIGIESDPAEGNMGLYKLDEKMLTEALNKNPEAVIKLFTFKPEKSFPVYKKYSDEEARADIGGFNVQMGWAMSDMTRTTDDYDSKTGDFIKSGKGVTRVLAENYADIITGIKTKISREERRIGMMEDRLTERFNRLEVTLAKLDLQDKSIIKSIEALEK